MSSKPARPLYTTVPWSPSNFCPKYQVVSIQDTNPDPNLISPVDYQTQQYNAQADNTLFTTPLQLDSSLISPLTPSLVAPAPTPEVLAAYPKLHQIILPQYPTQSPWSTCSPNQQLLTPQYPFFPSTIFAYPQPNQQFSLYPQHDINNSVPLYSSNPINTHPHPQENATDDLHDNTASAYSTSFGSTHHDTFQHEALAQNKTSMGIGSEMQGYKERMGSEMNCPFIPPNPTEINQSLIIDANSIIVAVNRNSNSNESSNYRFPPDPKSSPAGPMPTIDPMSTTWDNLIMGGENHGASGTIDGIVDHDRISAIPIIPPPSIRGSVDSSDNVRESGNGDGYDDNSSPSKRGRWSSSSSSLSKRTTTPLRKRRPPQLHLPPPSANMRLLTSTSHSAPADSFSLDICFPSASQRTDSTGTVHQEPPKVDGWISPEQRPVPPLGYTVPGSEFVPKIFEYGQGDQVVVPAEQVVAGDSTVAVQTALQPQPALQPYQPKAIPRVSSDPQIRFPNTSPPTPPAPYIIVPGLNGFEVAYWRPQTRVHPRHGEIFASSSLPSSMPISFPNMIPPTTAAPWEVSVPPMDPSVPPSTASSWESISSLDGHFVPPQVEVPPVVCLNRELRNRDKAKCHPPRYHPPPQEKKETWAICEVCQATISRASDLQRHMRKHTGEKPYHCPYCSYSYARNDKLSGHILKSHPGEPRIIRRSKPEAQTSSPTIEA